MNTDLFIVILPNKFSVFARTETGKIFDITGCQPSTYNKHGINLHGVLRNAKRERPEYISDLLTKGATLVFKKTKRGKARARSKSRFIVREEVQP